MTRTARRMFELLEPLAAPPYDALSAAELDELVAELEPAHYRDAGGGRVAVTGGASIGIVRPARIRTFGYRPYQDRHW